jgi:hypothetical protein
MTPRSLHLAEIALAIILVIALATVFADVFVWRP